LETSEGITGLGKAELISRLAEFLLIVGGERENRCSDKWRRNNPRYLVINKCEAYEVQSFPDHNLSHLLPSQTLAEFEVTKPL
jgi:hypothetical protein